MALVLTEIFKACIGDRYFHLWDVDFDSSYPAGGEAVSASDLGFASDPDAVLVFSADGYSGEYLPATDKLEIRAAIRKYSAALNPASMATDAVSSLAVTVTGVAADDVLVGIQPAAALEAGLVIQSARVTAADTITVELSNTSAGTVDGASLTADFYVTGLNGAAREVPDTAVLTGLTDMKVLAIGKFPK